MLRFTSIREPSTVFIEPQIFKLRFTHSSECHSNMFTFLGKGLMEDLIFETSVAHTNQRPHVQLDMVMTSDKGTTLSSDPDNSFKLPSCGRQFEVGLLGLYWEVLETLCRNIVSVFIHIYTSSNSKWLMLFVTLEFFIIILGVFFRRIEHALPWVSTLLTTLQHLL